MKKLIFALTLMAIELPFSYMAIEKWPLIIAIVILGIGVLNAFNFMDGINGMLGLNSLVILLSFLWLNSHSVDQNGNEIAIREGGNTRLFEICERREFVRVIAQHNQHIGEIEPAK